MNGLHSFLSLLNLTKPSLQTQRGVPQAREQTGMDSGKEVQSHDGSHWRLNSGQILKTSFKPHSSKKINKILFN